MQKQKTLENLTKTWLFWFFFCFLSESYLNEMRRKKNIKKILFVFCSSVAFSVFYNLFTSFMKNLIFSIPVYLHKSRHKRKGEERDKKKKNFPFSSSNKLKTMFTKGIEGMWIEPYSSLADWLELISLLLCAEQISFVNNISRLHDSQWYHLHASEIETKRKSNSTFMQK